MHLIDKECSHKFSWLEHLHNLPDQFIIWCLGEVCFKADVGELWLWGDVNGPVGSLWGKNEQSRITDLLERATMMKKQNATHVSLHPVHRVSTRVEHCGINHRTWNQVTNSTHLREQNETVITKVKLLPHACSEGETGGKLTRVTSLAETPSFM